MLITDSWNFKPLLAEAVDGYPYLLRLQAMECVCPLNNLRLLPGTDGRVSQCPRNQLADPEACRRCLVRRGHLSGDLHRAERQLSGVDHPDYHQRLVRVLRRAEAVLVVNPLTEALIRPSTPRVRVVTAGMDPARFPEQPEEQRPGASKCVFLFAGLVEEWIKGFAVLRDACRLLWQERRDFELMVTGDPPAEPEPFARYIGWQSQELLPRCYRAADLCVVPTIAQDALGRTAVEAMAAGRPVVASRIGGLPFTVLNGETGLLFRPGDPRDLAAQLTRLLGDPALRRRLGEAGRRRFEEHYTWNAIIERHYQPLLAPRKRVSVIVTVYQSHEVVRRQLLHLSRVLPPDTELILVDDGSDSPLRAICDAVEKPFDFVLLETRDHRPWTQPRARNLGAPGTLRSAALLRH